MPSVVDEWSIGVRGFRNDTGGENLGYTDKYLSLCLFTHHKTHKWVVLTEMHFIAWNVVTYRSHDKFRISQCSNVRSDRHVARIGGRTRKSSGILSVFFLNGCLQVTKFMWFFYINRVDVLGVVRKIAKRYYWLRHVCLPVRLSVPPHGTTQLPLDGYSWNLVFEYLSKICREKFKFN